jgi:hypothetical protein
MIAIAKLEVDAVEISLSKSMLQYERFGDIILNLKREPGPLRKAV